MWKRNNQHSQPSVYVGSDWAPMGISLVQGWWLLITIIICCNYPAIALAIEQAINIIDDSDSDCQQAYISTLVVLQVLECANFHMWEVYWARYQSENESHCSGYLLIVMYLEIKGQTDSPKEEENESKQKKTNKISYFEKKSNPGFLSSPVSYKRWQTIICKPQNKTQ